MQQTHSYDNSITQNYHITSFTIMARERDNKSFPPYHCNCEATYEGQWQESIQPWNIYYNKSTVKVVVVKVRWFWSHPMFGRKTEYYIQEWNYLPSQEREREKESTLYNPQPSFLPLTFNIKVHCRSHDMTTRLHQHMSIPMNTVCHSQTIHSFLQTQHQVRSSFPIF